MRDWRPSDKVEWRSKVPSKESKLKVKKFETNWWNDSISFFFINLIYFYQIWWDAIIFSYKYHHIINLFIIQIILLAWIFSCIKRFSIFNRLLFFVYFVLFSFMSGLCRMYFMVFFLFFLFNLFERSFTYLLIFWLILDHIVVANLPSPIKISYLGEYFENQCKQPKNIQKKEFGYFFSKRITIFSAHKVYCHQ